MEGCSGTDPQDAVSCPVIVRSDAQRDLAEIALWYERQQPGIGNYFLLCIDAAIKRAKRSPAVYPKFHGEYRRILIRKFPVGLFYLFIQNR